MFKSGGKKKTTKARTSRKRSSGKKAEPTKKPRTKKASKQKETSASRKQLELADNLIALAVQLKQNSKKSTAYKSVHA